MGQRHSTLADNGGRRGEYSPYSAFVPFINPPAILDETSRKYRDNDEIDARVYAKHEDICDNEDVSSDDAFDLDERKCEFDETISDENSERKCGFDEHISDESSELLDTPSEGFENLDESDKRKVTESKCAQQLQTLGDDDEDDNTDYLREQNNDHDKETLDKDYGNACVEQKRHVAVNKNEVSTTHESCYVVDSNGHSVRKDDIIKRADNLNESYDTAFASAVVVRNGDPKIQGRSEDEDNRSSGDAVKLVAFAHAVDEKLRGIMEWQIMNVGGLQSLTLGTWVGDHYQVADDCVETLTGLLEQLKQDEPGTRRQVAASHLVQKDLVPLLTELQDDPEVFSLAVRLLVCLTQPLEYLQVIGSGSAAGSVPGSAPPGESGQIKVVGPRPQFWEVGKMLLDVKACCTGPKFTWAIIREVKTIIDDTGQHTMGDEDCETINQCLLLVRNLLYIQDMVGGDGLSPVHLAFLKNLFQMGVDYILMYVLNAKQKDYWGATVVQVMSLLYRDLVGEIFLRFDNMPQCWDEPCDSSNCSACEAAMDRASILEPYLKTATYRTSRGSQNSQTTCRMDSTHQHQQQGENTTSMSLSSSSQNFHNKQSCSSGSGPGSGSSSPALTDSPVLTDKFDKMCLMTTEQRESTKDWEKGDKPKMFTEDSSDDLASSIVSSRDSPDTLQSEDSDASVVEELGSHLIDFTTKFIQGGFSNLVNVLKTLLIQNRDEGYPAKIDDSYFLWSIAFFLKFARRKELNIDFKNIREVFTADVVGFLVYKAFTNGEDVFLLSKNKAGTGLAMKRLHLCVSALRELFKTLTHQLSIAVSDEDKEYLNTFQKNLANMSDLRQLFVWLVRLYDGDRHSRQFLQDTIITNHYFLLLLEVWIEQKLCDDPQVTMLSHISQFATPGIMKNYGHLLNDFGHNDHHVNNCVFTMMHHVAGDCRKPDTLLHVNILNTFLRIWDSSYPVTQVMNDLMEYVIQKFISKAEQAPLECALQLFMAEGEPEDEAMLEEDGEKMDEGNWTSEEEDKLIMWYSELEGNPDYVEKIIQCFSEIGIRKTQVEIMNKLYENNWLASDDAQNVMTFDKDLQGIQDTDDGDENDETLHLLNKLFKIEEEQRDMCMELANVEEDGVVSFLVDNLVRQGLEAQLKFVQRALLEAAYVKIDKEETKTNQIEEPIMKHCVAAEQPIPLAAFSEDQEAICSNLHMRLLLRQLGFFMWDDCEQSPYPRMPYEWTPSEHVERAKMLGDISQDDVKFELDSLTNTGTSQTAMISNKDRDDVYMGLSQSNGHSVTHDNRTLDLTRS